MMPLTLIPAREVIRKLRRLGYLGPSPGGKHPLIWHPQTGQRITFPMHGKRDLKIGTLRAIVRQAGVDVDTWESL
jgi:predicted RNA binding protein YcfA (HicA-like mRNA interferase family)